MLTLSDWVTWGLRQGPSWWDSQSAGESALPHSIFSPATAHHLQSNRLRELQKGTMLPLLWNNHVWMALMLTNNGRHKGKEGPLEGKWEYHWGRAWKESRWKGWQKAWWGSRWQGRTNCALCHPLSSVLGTGKNIGQSDFSYNMNLLQGAPYGFQTSCLPLLLRQAGLSFSSLSVMKLLFLPWVCKPLYTPLLERTLSRSTWLIVALATMAMTCLLASFTVNQADVTSLSLVLLLLNFASAGQVQLPLCFTTRHKVITGCLRRCTSSWDPPTIRTWSRQHNTGRNESLDNMSWAMYHSVVSLSIIIICAA